MLLLLISSSLEFNIPPYSTTIVCDHKLSTLSTTWFKIVSQRCLNVGADFTVCPPVSSVDVCSVRGPPGARRDPSASASPPETQPGGRAASGGPFARMSSRGQKETNQSHGFAFPVSDLDAIRAARSDAPSQAGDGQNSHVHASVGSFKNSVELRPSSVLQCCRTSGGWWWGAGPAAQFTETSLAWFRRPISQRRSKERWIFYLMLYSISIWHL